MLKHVAAFAAAGALAFVAGCASPKDKLMGQCLKENNNNKTLCTCVVNGLSEKLTAKQLEALANAQEQSNASEAVQQALGMEGAMTVAQVGKTCSMGAIGGGASTAPGGN